MQTTPEADAPVREPSRTTDFTVIDVPVDKVRPNPKNPRPDVDLSDAAIAELAESMRSRGLLQPIRIHKMHVVSGETPDLLLVAGHRRLTAAKLLGWETIPALVYQGDEDDSIETILTENGQRRDLDVVQESALVGELLDICNGNVAEVARRLGRSAPWVAKRANLRGLSPRVRRLREVSETFGHWPTPWLEELALLTPEQQDTFLELDELPMGNSVAQIAAWKEHEQRNSYRWLEIETTEQLHGAIGERLRALSHATWDLADDSLVPAVGACVGCSQHSGATPYLFDASSGGNDSVGGVANAICRNQRCFAGKAAAQGAIQLAELREKYGSSLQLVPAANVQMTRARGGDGPFRVGLFQLPEGEVLADRFRLEECKVADEGARPSVIVSETGIGNRVRYMRDTRYAGKTGVRGRKKSVDEGQMELHDGCPGETPAEQDGRKNRVERLRRARLKVIVALVIDHVENRSSEEIYGVSTSGDDLLLEHVAGWGAGMIWGDVPGTSGEGRAKLLKLSYPKRVDHIWTMVRRNMLNILKGAALRLDEVDATETQLIAEATGMKWAELVKIAEDEKPVPKSWSDEERAAEPTVDGKPQKKKRSKKAAKKAAKKRVKTVAEREAATAEFRVIANAEDEDEDSSNGNDAEDSVGSEEAVACVGEPFTSEKS